MAVLGGVLMVSRKSPLGAAMALLLVLVSISAMYILLDAPFLAMVQIIVYAGAILVLIVYVIMLLNLREPSQGLSKFYKSPQKIIGIVAGGALFLEFAWTMAKTAISKSSGEIAIGNPEKIGEALLTTHLLPFEVASVLLLAAIVGAVILAKREKSPEKNEVSSAKEQS